MPSPISAAGGGLAKVLPGPPLSRLAPGSVRSRQCTAQPGRRATGQQSGPGGPCRGGALTVGQHQVHVEQPQGGQLQRALVTPPQHVKRVGGPREDGPCGAVAGVAPQHLLRTHRKERGVGEGPAAAWRALPRSGYVGAGRGRGIGAVRRMCVRIVARRRLPAAQRAGHCRAGHAVHCCTAWLWAEGGAGPGRGSRRHLNGAGGPDPGQHGQQLGVG